MDYVFGLVAAFEPASFLGVLGGVPWRTPAAAFVPCVGFGGD